MFYIQKFVENRCTTRHPIFLYASSAATYGNGALGYSDDHQLISKIKTTQSLRIIQAIF